MHSSCQSLAFVLEKEPILTISSQHACSLHVTPHSSHCVAELSTEHKVPSILFKMIVFGTYLGAILREQAIFYQVHDKIECKTSNVLFIWQQKG
jgi:hypothetical protein